ncbi:MAG: hypothetical protein OXU51_03095 [Candidatus Poribacteria bacterium]|nr:hypothetical protein [Candidatus Poribacteria bacterium]
MRHTSLITILAILGLGLLLNLGSPNTASAVEVKEWKNRVYGEAKVWGLYYNNPWTSSSHRVYIENFQNVTVQYTYEFNHSLLDADNNKRRVADDTIEGHGSIKTTARGGRPVTINGGQWLNLSEEENVPKGRRYYLSCYTRLNVRGRFNGENTNDAWETGTVEIGPFRY